MWFTTTEHISIHGGLHEDHPCLNCEVLSAAIYEYYIHVYQNAKPPYHKYIMKFKYKVGLNKEILELKYKIESLKDCIFKKNPD